MRVLLDKLLRNVVVQVEPFATCLLDAGWRLKLPGQSDVMFHFVLQGTGFVRGSEGKVHRLKRFHLAVVPKGTPHSLECGPEIRAERTVPLPPPNDRPVNLIAGEGAPDFHVACGVVHVSYGDSLGLFYWLRDVLVADLSPFPQARFAFETLLTEQSGASPGSELLSQALMSQCLVYFFRQLSSQPNGTFPWLAALQDHDLGRAIDCMMDSPGANHTVASLAETALMSRSAFSERFHDVFGASPIKFLRDVRLRRAAELLQRSPDIGIEDVARRVGFTSRSHFSEEFKERFGASPAAFRESWLTPEAR